MRKEGKRKALAALVCGSMLTVALVGGTLAYLSDTDSDVNVMTLGNVSIKQIEQERVDGTKLPTDAGNLKGFTQDKPLYPAVFEGDSIPWDTNYGVNEAWKAVASNENVVDKFVTVENTGDSAAYVRTIVAFEGNEEYGPEGEWIHVVFNGSNVSDEIQSSLVGVANIDGVDYTLYEFVYKKALEPGKTSIPSLKQVYMNKNATNEVVAQYGDTYEILVASQAVQTKGFAGAEAALDTAFYPVTATQHPWVDGVEIPTAVATAEELTAALEAGESIYLTDDVDAEAATTAPYGNKYGFKLDGGVLDGNGNELDIECYGDDYGIMTSGGTIKNITIEEGCRAVMIMYPTEDVILDNVNIGGEGVLYPINTGEAGAEGVDLIVSNSTLAGWTSYSNIQSASFTNVEFEQGTYYNNIYGRVLKPYVNTTLTNCKFIEHMNLDLSGLIDGHKVTIKNCTVNGQALTADVFTIPSTDEDYDTELFTVDLPSWATSVADCIVFE